MTNLAFAARSVLLCTLVTFGLAACSSDEGSSASAAAASTNPLVSPSVGLIDRSGGNVTQVTAPASNTATPVSTSTTAPSTNGSTPVATPPTRIVSTGAATLDWTPPTQNSDGSALTSLAGYTVYYGTAPDKLTESVKVSNPGLATYVLTNLASGTWYFAVTAYSAAGVESDRSGVVSTQI